MLEHSYICQLARCEAFNAVASPQRMPLRLTTAAQEETKGFVVLQLAKDCPVEMYFCQGQG